MQNFWGRTFLFKLEAMNTRASPPKGNVISSMSLILHLCFVRRYFHLRLLNFLEILIYSPAETVEQDTKFILLGEKKKERKNNKPLIETFCWKMSQHFWNKSQRNTFSFSKLGKEMHVCICSVGVELENLCLICSASFRKRKAWLCLLMYICVSLLSIFRSRSWEVLLWCGGEGCNSRH